MSFLPIPFLAAVITLAAAGPGAQGTEGGEAIVYLGLTDGVWQVRISALGGGRDRCLTQDPVDKTRLSQATARPGAAEVSPPWIISTLVVGASVRVTSSPRRKWYRRLSPTCPQ